MRAPAVAAHDDGPLVRVGAAGGQAGDEEALAPLLAHPVVGEELVHFVALLRPLGPLAHHHQAAAIVAPCMQGVFQD